MPLFLADVEITSHVPHSMSLKIEPYIAIGNSPDIYESRLVFAMSAITTAHILRYTESQNHILSHTVAQYSLFGISGAKYLETIIVTEYIS